MMFFWCDQMMWNSPKHQMMTCYELWVNPKKAIPPSPTIGKQNMHSRHWCNDLEIRTPRGSLARIPKKIINRSLSNKDYQDYQCTIPANDASHHCWAQRQCHFHPLHLFHLQQPVQGIPRHSKSLIPPPPSDSTIQMKGTLRNYASFQRIQIQQCNEYRMEINVGLQYTIRCMVGCIFQNKPHLRRFHYHHVILEHFNGTPRSTVLRRYKGPLRDLRQGRVLEGAAYPFPAGPTSMSLITLYVIDVFVVVWWYLIIRVSIPSVLHFHARRHMVKAPGNCFSGWGSQRGTAWISDPGSPDVWCWDRLWHSCYLTTGGAFLKHVPYLWLVVRQATCKNPQACVPSKQYTSANIWRYGRWLINKSL